MAYKSHKITVDKSNPFKNDALWRQSHVDNFVTLLANISTPIVLSVNAPWGQGKTIFLEMIHAQLQNKGLKSVYFSAWETDFVSDPLQAFLGEIDKQIQSIVKGNKKKKQAWETAKKAGSRIVKSTLPALVKIGTAGILDIEKVAEDELSKLMGGLTKDFLAEYTKNKKSIAQFKKEVSKILSNKGEESTKLFILIDELDRCRPTYAIELLERIKHLFDIEGLVFVLSMDKEQLSHSVKSIYGADFEAIGYLRRFIDIEYTLPEKELDRFITQLYTNFGFDEFFEKRMEYRNLQNDREHLKDVFIMLAKAKKLSLREVEQLFAKINLVIKATAENTYLYPILLVFLIVAKEYSYEDYDNYMNKGGTSEGLIKVLYSLIPETERNEPNSKPIRYSSKWTTSRLCAFIESYLIKARDGYGINRENTLQQHKDIADDKTASEGQRYYSSEVIKFAEHIGGWGGGVDIENLKRRIDMVEDFQFNK